MAYTKTTWVDNSLPAINSTNLNNIESGIEANDTAITTLQTNLENKIIDSSGTNYIKYTDGTMICFMSYTTNTNINNTWGNLYISSQITLNNYPVAFTTAPIVNLTVQGSEGAMIMNGDQGTYARPPKVYLVRGASLSSSTNFYINITAIGKWK